MREDRSELAAVGEREYPEGENPDRSASGNSVGFSAAGGFSDFMS